MQSKGKFHLTTGHEGPEGSTGIAPLFLGARCGWLVNAMPQPLYRWEGPGTQCTGGWVDPGINLDGC